MSDDGNSTEGHLRIRDLAARWNMNEDTVRKLIKLGMLPCVQLSPRCTRVPLHIVIRFEQTHLRSTN